MWQILYPKDKYPTAWFSDSDLPPHMDELRRFWKEQTKLYKSNDVYDWNAFHYGYDQMEPMVLADGSLETADARRTRVIQYVGATYNSTATAADFAPNSIIKPEQVKPKPLVPQNLASAALVTERPPKFTEEATLASAEHDVAADTVDPIHALAALEPAHPNVDIREHPDYIANVIYDR